MLTGRLAAVAQWRCPVNRVAEQANESLQSWQGRWKHRCRESPTSLLTGTRMHANTCVSSSWQDGNEGLWSLSGLLQPQHGQGGLVLQGTLTKKQTVPRTNCLKGNSGWHIFWSRSHEIRSPPAYGCDLCSGYSKANPACCLWEALAWGRQGCCGEVTKSRLCRLRVPTG